MKTAIEIHLYLPCNTRLFSNPMVAETAKAFSMELPTGKYLHSASEEWFPKSQCEVIKQSETYDKSSDCLIIKRHVIIPEWLAVKKNLT